MVRKWFQVKGEDWSDFTSADAVSVDIEDVAAFRRQCLHKSLVLSLQMSSHRTFANGAAYDAKQEPLKASASLVDLGKDEANALIVVVAKAVFTIVEEDKDGKGVGVGVFQGVGICVFFSATLAVTGDHNLTEQDTVGSSVTLALKEEMANVEVVARNAELDFAILKSSEPRSFIAPWNGSADDLESRCDPVLASFRLGIGEFQASYKGKLGFAPAACIAISSLRRHIIFSCPTYAVDSGAALLVKDGCLVGIHLETINALREEMDRKKVIKDRLNDVEESLDNLVRSGLAQGCSGLLVHEFKNAVSE
ncbi:hypothetical protein PF003_g15390 [Phytophthora fragariae]|nr:hypothetical protein PF003_g15390 [Phytophthora fragariae]